MLLCDLQLKTAPQIFLALKKPEKYYNTISKIKIIQLLKVIKH